MTHFVNMGNYCFNGDYIKYVYLSDRGTCNVVIKNTNRIPAGTFDTVREFKKEDPEYKDCVNFLRQRNLVMPIFSPKRY